MSNDGVATEDNNTTPTTPVALMAGQFMRAIRKLGLSGIRDVAFAAVTNKITALAAIAADTNIDIITLRLVADSVSETTDCWFCGRTKDETASACVCMDRMRLDTFVNLTSVEAIEARIAKYGPNVLAYRWACRMCTKPFYRRCDDVLPLLKEHKEKFVPTSLCNACKKTKVGPRNIAHGTPVPSIPNRHKAVITASLGAIAARHEKEEK